MTLIYVEWMYIITRLGMYAAKLAEIEEYNKCNDKKMELKPAALRWPREIDQKARTNVKHRT